MLLDALVGEHGIDGGLELGVLGQGGISASLAAEGLLAPLGEVGLGLALGQLVREDVVQHHVGQGELVTHSEAVVGQRGLNAAHPPGQVAGGVALAGSGSSNIGGSLVEPLVHGLGGGLFAPLDDGAVGGVHLLHVLAHRNDLRSLQVVVAQQTVLSGEVEVDGSGLADVLVADLGNGHTAKVGVEVTLRLLVSSVDVVTLLFL